MKWMKKYKKIIVILLVFLLVGIPCSIHILYKIHIPVEFFDRIIPAGDLLNYIGSILTFIGTIAVSVSIYLADQKKEKELDLENKKLEIYISENQKFYIFCRKERGKYIMDFKFSAITNKRRMNSFVKIEFLSFCPPQGLGFNMEEKSCSFTYTEPNKIIISAYNIEINKQFYKEIKKNSVYDCEIKEISEKILFVMNVSISEKNIYTRSSITFCLKGNDRHRKKENFCFLIQDITIKEMITSQQ